MVFGAATFNPPDLALEAGFFLVDPCPDILGDDFFTLGEVSLGSQPLTLPQHICLK